MSTVLTKDTPILGAASQKLAMAITIFNARADALGERRSGTWYNRTRDYTEGLWKYGPKDQVDPWVAFVQAWHETDGFDSPRYRASFNPAGLDVPLDSSTGVSFDDGIDMAVTHVACLFIAATKPSALSSLIGLPALTNLGAMKFLQRWFVKYQQPECPIVTAVGTLNKVYTDAVTGDMRATWAVDPLYQNSMTTRAAQMLRLGGEQPSGGDSNVETKPTILVIAGHRSYNDGGNPAEKLLTPALAREYRDAFRGAGYECTWLQETDGDTDPDDTVGGLDTVSRRAAEWCAKQPGAAILFDLHYEGSPAPGVFVIVPDVTGLTTGAPVTQDPNDTWENNGLDRKLAREIANRIGQATGLPLRSGIREPGVMDESQTGVGYDGYRLATFAYTSPYRNDTVRLVVEHGNHTHFSDRVIIFQPDFSQKCAAAALEAVKAIYGAGDSEVPDVPADEATANKPGKINWERGDVGIGRYKKVDVLRFVFEVTCTKRTTPRVAANGKAKTSGPAIEVGQTRVAIGKLKSGWGFLEDGSRVNLDYFSPEILWPE